MAENRSGCLTPKQKISGIVQIIIQQKIIMLTQWTILLKIF